MQTSVIASATADALAKAETPARILVGFDGFVDRVVSVVDKWYDFEHWSKIEAVAEFADRIHSAAESSFTLQIDVARSSLGGNGPIMARALIAQGHEVEYIGALGKESLHQVFSRLVSQCTRATSLGDPGETLSFEFLDGKVMMSQQFNLCDVSWERLLSLIPQDELVSRVNATALVGCVNWSLLPLMNTFYRGLTNVLQECFSRKAVFIDLASPNKRTDADLSAALGLLIEMQQHADVILGLNSEESSRVASVVEASQDGDLTERAAQIRSKTGVAQVVIHTPRKSAVATAQERGVITGPYTSTPKTLTGAGDHFNAGYCSGYLADISAVQSLMIGMTTAGLFVRNGSSPSRTEVIQFMQEWSATLD